MAQVALDLTPVVDVLLEHPFDQGTLDRASATVGGRTQAYATALRCAAKRTEDKLAAAYFLTEAARVHESADDLGGALALLWRAREFDRENPRTTELMAACMTRLAMRSGLDFRFSAPASVSGSRRADESLPPPVETGLRPAARERPRDTLPELFGLDAPESSRNDETLVIDTLSDGWDGSEDPKTLTANQLPDLPRASLDSNPVVFKLEASRRVEPMLPPVNPDPDALLLMSADFTPPPSPTRESEPVLLAIAQATLQRSAETAPATTRDLVVAPAPALRAPESMRPVEPAYREVTAPPAPKTRSVGESLRAAADEVYGDPAAPKTERPLGDQLVGALFEALHGLHFVDDAASGASFVARVLEEKMQASTILVHVYDINSRHFVVMNAVSSRAAALSDYATPEDEPFVVELMKEEEATLVLDPMDDPRLSRGRWLLAAPQRSLLCAPAVLDGRYMGLIEIADPLDGSEFTEDDRNALTYAASAFARFLDKKGIVLSEDAEPSRVSASG